MKTLLLTLLAVVSTLGFSQTEVKFYSIDLSLTVWTETGDYEFDVHPTFILSSPLTDKLTPRQGMSAPYLILSDYNHEKFLEAGGCHYYSTGHGHNDVEDGYCQEDFYKEEYLHSRYQWASLGAYYPVLYFMTLGEGFEPYPSACGMGSKWGCSDEDYFKWDKMQIAAFEPTKDNCPLMTITQDSLTMFPCYRF